MHQKTQGIVLHSLKYGDNSLIVKIFTKDYGLKSFMIKGFRGKKSTLKVSLFMPLTIITMDISSRSVSSAFNSIREAHCEEPLHNIHVNFSKQAVALFISETLYKTIADDAAHPDLYDFIGDLLKYLDQAESVPSSLPHYFLVRYSQYLGLYPNSNGEDEAVYFDMRDGIFQEKKNLHSDFMMEEESNALKLLLNCTIEDLPQIKFGNSLRNNLLLGLMQYYKIHLLNFRDIKSHVVLAEVLRG